MAKSAVKSVFSLHPLPVISPPKPPFFVRSSHFWGKNHLFRGVFLFSSREILARNLILRRKNQFDGVFLFGIRPYFDFCRRGKGGRRRFSLPPPLRSKNTSRLSLQTSPLFATSSLVSLKTSLPHTNSPSLLRARHAPTRIYAPAHSANLPFLPSPSPSPQQPVIQHLVRLPLQKTGEGKRVKTSHTTHNRSTLYTQKVKRWRQK